MDKLEQAKEKYGKAWIVEPQNYWKRLTPKSTRLLEIERRARLEARRAKRKIKRAYESEN